MFNDDCLDYHHSFKTLKNNSGHYDFNGKEPIKSFFYNVSGHAVRSSLSGVFVGKFGDPSRVSVLLSLRGKDGRA